MIGTRGTVNRPREMALRKTILAKESRKWVDGGRGRVARVDLAGICEDKPGEG